MNNGSGAYMLLLVCLAVLTNVHELLEIIVLLSKWKESWKKYLPCWKRRLMRWRSWLIRQYKAFRRKKQP
jgi:hypothetical protein